MPGRRIDVQDEDLRLAYVAMTRAQSQLILWWAATANTPTVGCTDSCSAVHRTWTR